MSPGSLWLPNELMCSDLKKGEKTKMEWLLQTSEMKNNKLKSEVNMMKKKTKWIGKKRGEEANKETHFDG